MSNHTFEMSKEKALLVHGLIDNHMKAMKNWIVSAVRSGDGRRAKRLAVELQEYEALYAGFNLKVRLSHSPEATTHRIRED